jgi:hypothetical protein
VRPDSVARNTVGLREASADAALAGSVPIRHLTLSLLRGDWYERRDLKALRERIRGRGLDIPLLRQILRARVRFLSQNAAPDDVDDDT